MKMADLNRDDVIRMFRDPIWGYNMYPWDFRDHTVNVLTQDPFNLFEDLVKELTVRDSRSQAVKDDYAEIMGIALAECVSLNGLRKLPERFLPIIFYHHKILLAVHEEAQESVSDKV
ncbi:hypothetical protein ACFL21_00120 [Patescibacteria group bacterium]